VPVTRYGRPDTVAVADIGCLSYGAFDKRLGRLVAVTDTGRGKTRQLMLFTTDLTATAEQVIARYVARWSIEVAIGTAKGSMGVGQARNRVPAAVKRTVPFGTLTMSLAYLWYTLHGHHPADVTDRRAAQLWYTTKTEPSFDDMLAKLRRTIIAADLRRKPNLTIYVLVDARNRICPVSTNLTTLPHWASTICGTRLGPDRELRGGVDRLIVWL